MIKTDINEKLVEQVFGIYQDAELKMLEKVARRAKRGLKEGWAEQKLSDIIAVREELQALMADTTKLSRMKVSQGIIDAYLSGVRSAEKDLGYARTALEYVVPERIQRLVLETSNLIEGTAFQVLRTVDDKYRQIQAETSTGVLTGTDTRLQATQESLNRFADAGITGFVDSAGRRWMMDTYAEMATRTATARAALQGHLDRQTELGSDLIKLSSISATCPICARWQGKVLSISGQTPGYPTLEAAKADGVFHPNCKHTILAYFPGISKPPEDEVPNNEGLYNKMQEQRKNERMIRKWKRREAVALTPEEQVKAQQKVKMWQQAQRDLIDETGLKRKYARESIKARTGDATKRTTSYSGVKPITKPDPIPTVPVARKRKAKAVKELKDTTEAVNQVITEPVQVAKPPRAITHELGVDKILSDIEKSSSSKKVEYFSGLDPNGKVVFKNIKGEAESVNISASDMERIRGGILTHNHPLQYKGEKVAFSPEDLSVAVKAGLKEIRAVNPEYVTAFARSESAIYGSSIWGNNQMMNEFKSGYSKIIRSAEKEIKEAGKISPSKHAEIWGKYTDQQISYMATNQEKYGYKFMFDTLEDSPHLSIEGGKPTPSKRVEFNKPVSPGSDLATDLAKYRQLSDEEAWSISQKQFEKATEKQKKLLAHGDDGGSYFMAGKKSRAVNGHLRGTDPNPSKATVANNLNKAVDDLGVELPDVKVYRNVDSKLFKEVAPDIYEDLMKYDNLNKKAYMYKIDKENFEMNKKVFSERRGEVYTGFDKQIAELEEKITKAEAKVREQAPSIVDLANKKLSGVEFQEKGFMSVSYDSSKNIFDARPYELEILVDEKTKGIIANQFIGNDRESEILFAPGHKLQILETRVEERVSSHGISHPRIKILARLIKE